MSRDVKITLTGQDNASDDIKKVEKSLGGLGSSAVSIGKTIAGAMAGAFALDKLTTFAKGSLDEFLEAEAISVKLDNRLANLGDSATVSRAQIDAMADSIHRFTTFEDDAAVAAADLLLGVKGLTSEGFGKAMDLSADLAAKLGSDLPEAAQLLAKALADPEKGMKALRAAGIFLDDQEKELIKTLDQAGKQSEAMAAMMEAASKRVGNAAEEMANTTSGKIAMMGKQWGDLKEMFGEKVLAPQVGMLHDLMLEIDPGRLKGNAKAIEARIESLKKEREHFSANALAPDWSNPNIWSIDRQLKQLNEMRDSAKAATSSHAIKPNDSKFDPTFGMLDGIGKGTEDVMRKIGKVMNDGKDRFRQMQRDAFMHSLKWDGRIPADMKFKDAQGRWLPQKRDGDPSSNRPFGGDSLSPTVSRFLTRGGGMLGMVEPMVREQRAANRIAQQQLAALNALLKKPTPNPNPSAHTPANFH